MTSKGRDTLTSRLRHRLRDDRGISSEDSSEDLKFRWSRILKLVKLMSGSTFSRYESEKVRDEVYLEILSRTKRLLEEDEDEKLIREFASFLYRSCEDSDVESKFKERAREMGLRVVVKSKKLSVFIQEIQDLSKKLNEWRYRHSIPEYGRDVVVSVGDSFVLPSISRSEQPSSKEEDSKTSTTTTTIETSAELCRWLVQIAEHHIVMTSSAFEPLDLAKSIFRTLLLSHHTRKYYENLALEHKNRHTSQVQFGTGDTDSAL